MPKLRPYLAAATLLICVLPGAGTCELAMAGMATAILQEHGFCLLLILTGVGVQIFMACLLSASVPVAGE